jgi:hypothetical protein
MTAVYEYGQRGDLPPVKVFWHQGEHKPLPWLQGKLPLKNAETKQPWNDGHLFVGDKGMLLSDYGKHVLLPEEKFAGFQPPEPFLRESPGHHAEWLNACRTGSPTGSPFDYAAALTVANHLGNVAFRAGETIRWDDSQGTIVENPRAEAFLGRANPRSGWSLE